MKALNGDSLSSSGLVVCEYILTEMGVMCAEKGSEQLEWWKQFSHLHWAYPVAAVVFPEVGSEGLWVGMEIPKPPSPNTQGEELAILLALISGNLYVFDRKPVLCLSGFCCSAEKASYMGTKDSTAYY